MVCGVRRAAGDCDARQEGLNLYNSELAGTARPNTGQTFPRDEAQSGRAQPGHLSQ